VLHVIGCITAKHDMRLVAIACIICAVASLTTLQMLARAQAARGRLRWAWVGAGGGAFGCGVWATHFVAMLAYRPDMQVAFDLPLTVLSLVLPIAGGSLALACGIGRGRTHAVVAGLVFGAAIGAMHFTGMAAYEVPGVLTYDTGDVVAAWAVGFAFAPLAMLRFRAGRVWQATILLVLAIAGLHFTAMAAVSIVPNRVFIYGTETILVAVIVGAAGFLIVIAGLLSALIDKHLEQRARWETERFRRFADATFEGLFFLEHGVVADANAVLCRMLGRTTAQIVGARVSAFFAPSSHAALKALAAPSDGTSGCAELELLDASGARHVVDVLARSLAEGDDAVAVVAVRDASERKRAERRIQELAYIDPLTGLANRRLLHERLIQALADAERTAGTLAVLWIDLDRFKAVNDHLGHHAGDSLLVVVAGRLRMPTRDADIIARLGGDEFIVVQPGLDQPEAAVALGEVLVRVLADPYLIDGRQVEVTASIGISLYPKDAVDGDALLRQADVALHRAKQEGRCGYRFFEPAMDAKVRARRELEQDLRHALANGELHLHYQPVFESQHLALVGYEALLRWLHPRHGPISPAEFIPIAEECGAILVIGSWVLETACAAAVSWPRPYTIAVNLSPAQFKNHNLPGEVGETLARTGLAPGRLELEVTEGVLIENSGRALAVLGALKAQGVHIALDDFGTGYSSLSYLRRFRFDRIKIDRSFIAELGIDADADAIVACILAMARTLRLEVTGEGVESELQLSLLQKMHCSHVQGFLLGRPAALAQLAHKARSTAVAA
jgi:diguanylate cyclase (GGDEF)-like protein/PAS domain S-box-containing protein